MTKDFRKMVREQIASYLRQEIEGESETLLKEVWEECDTDADAFAVRDAISDVIAWLERE